VNAVEGDVLEAIADFLKSTDRYLYVDKTGNVVYITRSDRKRISLSIAGDKVVVQRIQPRLFANAHNPVSPIQPGPVLIYEKRIDLPNPATDPESQILDAINNV
jgi:hypothetical protein